MSRELAQILVWLLPITAVGGLIGWAVFSYSRADEFDRKFTRELLWDSVRVLGWIVATFFLVHFWILALYNSIPR